MKKVLNLFLVMLLCSVMFVSCNDSKDTHEVYEAVSIHNEIYRILSCCCDVTTGENAHFYIIDYEDIDYEDIDYPLIFECELYNIDWNDGSYLEYLFGEGTKTVTELGNNECLVTYSVSGINTDNNTFQFNDQKFEFTASFVVSANHVGDVSEVEGNFHIASPGQFYQNFHDFVLEELEINGEKYDTKYIQTLFDYDEYAYYHAE